MSITMILIPNTWMSVCVSSSLLSLLHENFSFHHQICALMIVCVTLRRLHLSPHSSNLIPNWWRLSPGSPFTPLQPVTFDRAGERNDNEWRGRRRWRSSQKKLHHKHTLGFDSLCFKVHPTEESTRRRNYDNNRKRVEGRLKKKLSCNLNYLFA